MAGAAVSSIIVCIPYRGLHRCHDTLGVCASLTPKGAVLDAPERVGLAHQAHAAVFRGVVVDGDDGVDDLVRVGNPLRVPVLRQAIS